MVRSYDENAIPSVYNRKEIEKHEQRPGVSQQYFRGLDALVGFTIIDASAERSEPHTHPWEQINFVIEGNCTFIIGEERIEISQGDLFTIPPNVPHASEPPETSCTICFISPLREDYLDRTTYQQEFPPIE